MSDNKVDDTIIKMVTNLKATVDGDVNSFSFGSALKRSFSSVSNESNNSFEDHTPLKKIKQERKLDLNYIGSPREMRRLRADLLEARNTILNLENRIQHMHSVRKEMQIMYENETRALKKQHEHDRKSVEELEIQLQSLRKREMELKEQLSDANNKYNVMKVTKDEEIDELEKSLSEMKEESRLFDGEENAEIILLNRKLAELQMMLDAAEGDAEAQKCLVNELEKRLSIKNSLERDLEKKDQALQAARLRIKELEYAKENFLEFQEQAKTQAHKLANYVDLEKEVQKLQEENTRLKDEVRNKLILEEEVNDLKSRFTNYKEQEKKFTNLQMQQVQTEMYLDEWRSVARGICETTGSDSSLPHLLRSAVERLQQQEISLTSAKVELESQLTSAQYDAKVAKAELEKTQKLLSDMKKNAEQKQNLFHRMQKKLSLVSRERDSYRLQLDSYEKDLTMSLNTTSTSGTNSSQMQALRERIDNLEKIVESYRELNAKLESDLQNSNPALYSDAAPARAEQVSKLQEEVDQLKLENEMLRQRRDQLEIQLEDYIVGQDTLQGGQVYHLANNPLSECLAQREQLVEKLEQEIERLKRKLKNIEDGLESSKLSESLCPQEVQSLKEQIKNHESQTQRLKDYFKSSMQEFRNVIYMLLGYKVDRTSNSLYKLTSIYAERSEDQLCFQLNNEGALNLLENEFSATLEQMVNLHLRHQKSIPVFLSALTIDLFNNSTMATKTFEIE